MTRSLARNDRKRDVEDAAPYGVQQSYGDVEDAVPYNGSPYPSAGGDAHTSPRRTNAHFAAGHMGPALQGTPVMQDGTSGRRPLQRLTVPVRRGRCPHIAPPAAQRGRRKRLPACRKSPDGLFRQAGRQNRKIKTTFYFAILVAAAGDWTRKGTLTVPFHTILPSDICDRTGSLTG